jgi:hypothetical protein
MPQDFFATVSVANKPQKEVAMELIICKISKGMDDILQEIKKSRSRQALLKRTFHVKHPEVLWVKYSHFLIKKAAL